MVKKSLQEEVLLLPSWKQMVAKGENGGDGGVVSGRACLQCGSSVLSHLLPLLFHLLNLSNSPFAVPKTIKGFYELQL